MFAYLVNSHTVFHLYKHICRLASTHVKHIRYKKGKDIDTASKMMDITQNPSLVSRALSAKGIATTAALMIQP